LVFFLQVKASWRGVYGGSLGIYTGVINGYWFLLRPEDGVRSEDEQFGLHDTQDRRDREVSDLHVSVNRGQKEKWQGSCGKSIIRWKGKYPES